MPAPQYSDIRLNLGPLQQVGYVVSDVESSAKAWVRNCGIGPWRIKSKVSFDSCEYHGNASEITFNIATAFSDGIEIKLIAQESGPSSIYSDFLDLYGPGIQHACFYPADYEKALKVFLDNGASVIFEGVIGGAAFSYLKDALGQMIELVDLPTEVIDLRSKKALEGSNWDGSDPIRKVK